MPGIEEELTTPIVEAMFQEAKRVKNVRRLDIHLDNWAKDGGRWRRKVGAETDKEGSGTRISRRKTDFTKMPKVFQVQKKTGGRE